MRACIIYWSDNECVTLRQNIPYPNFAFCFLDFVLFQGDQVSRQEDQQDYIDLLQTATEEDSLLVAAPRKRRNTNDNMSSDHRTGLFSTDMHVEKLEARLAHMEDLLAKIVVSLKRSDGSKSLKKSQSTNDLFVTTSYV